MNVKDIFSTLSVKSLDEAQAFYVDKLGMKVARDEMGLRLVLPHGGEVFVYEKPDHSPATFTVLSIVVESIDAAVDELAGKGVAFKHYDNMPGSQDDREIMRGKSANMGPDIAWFTDPSDNVIAVLEP